MVENGSSPPPSCLISSRLADEYDAPIPSELAPYLDQTKPIPIPTYFIGAWGRGARTTLTSLSTTPHPSLSYLGRSGISTLHHLQIAFLDGRFNSAALSNPSRDPHCCPFYSSLDLAHLRTLSERVVGAVDLLLTIEFPSGLTRHLPESLRPSQPAPHALPPAEAAQWTRPRYHVAGNSPVFYARLPYLNLNLGLGAHVTRFIGLACVGNEAKQKSLHALNVTPSSQMSEEQLNDKPSDTTPCPWTSEGEGGHPAQRDATTSRKRNDATANTNTTTTTTIPPPPDDALGDQSWRWQDTSHKKQRNDSNNSYQAAPSHGDPSVIKDVRKTIFVRNIPRFCDVRELKEFFAPCGTVVDVRRVLDKGGRLNTWAHLQFDTVEAARQALALSGTELLGQTISIEAAQGERPSTATTTLPSSLPLRPMEGCWFCLSNPSCASWLIASIAQQVYLSLDKSPLDPTSHVLLIPIEHYPSTMQLPLDAWREMRHYLVSLSHYFGSIGRDMVVFERYMQFKKGGGNHCHLNVIGIPRRSSGGGGSGGAVETFQRVARQYDFVFQQLDHAPFTSPLPLISNNNEENKDNTSDDSRTPIRNLVGDGEYLLIYLPFQATCLIKTIREKERIPISLLRDVAAELTGRLDRANWKNCVCKDKREEEDMAERFKEKFAPFDYTLKE